MSAPVPTRMELRRLALPAVALAAAALAALLSSTAHAQEGAPSDDEWFAGERGFAAKLSVGPAVHRLHEIWVISGDAEVAIGAQTPSGGWYGTVGARFGSTDGGLGSQQLGAGLSWEAPVVPHWHLGVGLDLTGVWFDRVSSDGTISDFGAGGRVFTTYDVLHRAPVAIFVGAELGIDAYVDNGVTPLYGGGLRLGARIF